MLICKIQFNVFCLNFDSNAKLQFHDAHYHLLKYDTEFVADNERNMYDV